MVLKHVVGTKARAKAYAKSYRKEGLKAMIKKKDDFTGTAYSVYTYRKKKQR